MFEGDTDRLDESVEVVADGRNLGNLGLNAGVLEVVDHLHGVVVFFIGVAFEDVRHLRHVEVVVVDGHG